MRLLTDSEIDISIEELTLTAAKFHHEIDQSKSIEDTRATIKNFQPTRHLVLLLNCIITVHVAYDPAVFLTDAEYVEQGTSNAEAKQLQSIIEQPFIYMLAAGSSSIVDQASLLYDKEDCINSLAVPISTSPGHPSGR